MLIYLLMKYSPLAYVLVSPLLHTVLPDTENKRKLLYFVMILCPGSPTEAYKGQQFSRSVQIGPASPTSCQLLYEQVADWVQRCVRLATIGECISCFLQLKETFPERQTTQHSFCLLLSCQPGSTLQLLMGKVVLLDEFDTTSKGRCPPLLSSHCRFDLVQSRNPFIRALLEGAD